MIVEVYKREDGKWAWRALSGSDIVATDGGQGYENRGDAISMASLVTKVPVSDMKVKED